MGRRGICDARALPLRRRTRDRPAPAEECNDTIAVRPKLLLYGAATSTAGAGAPVEAAASCASLAETAAWGAGQHA